MKVTYHTNVPDTHPQRHHLSFFRLNVCVYTVGAAVLLFAVKDDQQWDTELKHNSICVSACVWPFYLL